MSHSALDKQLRPPAADQSARCMVQYSDGAARLLQRLQPHTADHLLYHLFSCCLEREKAAESRLSHTGGKWIFIYQSAQSNSASNAARFSLLHHTFVKNPINLPAFITRVKKEAANRLCFVSVVIIFKFEQLGEKKLVLPLNVMLNRVEKTIIFFSSSSPHCLS